MTSQVTLTKNNITFPVEESESILDAAVNQGISFPYACKKGICGACKGKVVQGEFDYIIDPTRLSEEEKQQGFTLFCCVKAKQDLEIEIDLVEEIKDIEIKHLPSKVQELKKLAHDVMYIMLKLPQNQSLAFLPGQYIDIVMQDDKKRSFSIANMPNDKSEIELHIRHIEGGLFTGEVFSSMKVNDILRIEGPFGAFFYREEANRPMIFMAGGTGFAPVKSIMEYIISTKVSLPIYIYWGARTEQDLYLKELAENWAQQYDNVHFIPVLSDPNIKEQDWQGKRGYVHHAICQDFNDLSTFDIYACGPPLMIEAGEKAFKEKGLISEHFYYDSFDFSTN